MESKVWRAVGVCGVAVLAALIFVVGSIAFDAHKRTAIPGTGVKMILPDGVSVSPLGTTFSDIRHEVTVGVFVGSVSTDAPGRQAFPTKGEPFRTSTIGGVLYQRTRSVGNGMWDGWLLNVLRGNRSLSILISYTGSEPEKFQELKKILSTVSWNEHEVDPEVSFGLRLNIPGLHLVRDVVGGIEYTVDGMPSSVAPHIYVFGVPYDLKGDMSKFHRLCEKDAETVASGAPISIRYQSKDKLWVCDAWDQSYTAVLMLPDGSIALILAQGDPNVFQTALLNAQVIPRLSSNR